MYVKYKSLIASFRIDYGRVSWKGFFNEAYGAFPERFLDHEERICVSGALIAWSQDTEN